jgi:radical SAM superfamily enzyme YgiQ (UPF0313 family)
MKGFMKGGIQSPGTSGYARIPRRLSPFTQDQSVLFIYPLTRTIKFYQWDRRYFPFADHPLLFLFILLPPRLLRLPPGPGLCTAFPFYKIMCYRCLLSSQIKKDYSLTEVSLGINNSLRFVSSNSILFNGSKMKVVIIAPAGSSYIWRKRRAAFTMPPMALPLLAAVTPPEFQVHLIDEAVEDVDLNLKADLVGLSAITATASRAYVLADHFRSRGIKVVMGGVHPSTLPEEALQHCDSVAIGEGERLWPQILADAARGHIERTYQGSPSFPLDNLPAPRWDLLPAKRYFIPQTVQVSRGCPMACSFCSVSSFFGRPYRLRPIPQALEEIKALKRKLFIFVDDDITGVPDFAKELFASMIPLKKKWVGQCSLSIADDTELLRLAARSGCIGLLIGFESISPEVLRSIGKQVNLRRKYEEAIHNIHKRGIHIQGSFIFGFDGDTPEGIRATVDFVKQNRITGVNYCHLTPFPGTRLFSQLEQEGRILHRDWSKYDRQNIVFQPRHFTPESLQDQIFWAYRQTYNLRSLWQRRPFSFQHMSLYLALNFGYMKGVRKMEQDAKKSRKNHLPASTFSSSSS